MSTVIEALKPYLKAVVAAATPAILLFVNEALLSANSWVIGVVTVVLTTVAVWATPNVPG